MASKVVLLIPLARYYNYLEAHTSSDAWPKIVEMILSTTADILERMQNKEAILLLSSSEKKNGGFFEKIANLAQCHEAEIKLLAGMDRWAELLIHAKPIVDEIGADELYIVHVRTEEIKCRDLVSLIFNKNTYNIGYAAINVNFTFYGEAEEDNLVHIKEILSGIPSSDGFQIKTLKSKAIPGDIFYHGFTTRCGGVSTYPTMKSLPLAMSLRKKDTRVYIEENRKRLAKAEGFNFESFECASVVHGTDVWVIGDDQPNSYDAIATNRLGVTIAAPGADCQTLLFCDVKKRVVAAAHSGWKGTIDRIQQNVVKVMKERFDCKTKDIHVSIGPSIGVCCYNVDEERANMFVNSVGECVVERRDGKAFLNLWKATVILLEEIGIERENIDDGTSLNERELIVHDKVTQCTQCNKDKFFSYRRDGPLFGNQIGFIGINPHLIQPLL